MNDGTIAVEGNKLPFIHENPFDIVCLKISERISPWFKSVGATPNHITTLSVIASALAVYNIYVGGPRIMFVIWALLSYFFDCLDGHYARRYDMCSKFGDYYDHLSDWGYFIALFYVAFFVRGLNDRARGYRIAIYGLIVFFGIGTMVHMGLQETLYQSSNDNESPTLTLFSKLSSKLCGSPVDCIAATRFFGVGTFITAMIALIVLFVR